MLISCQRKEKKEREIDKGKSERKENKDRKRNREKEEKEEKNMCVDKWEEVRRKKGNKEKRVWRRAEDICLI